MEFQRFLARETLLELLTERTNAWGILRQFCDEVGREIVSGLDETGGQRLQMDRQWQVGLRWLRICGLYEQWAWRWIVPAIPPRWLTPWLPVPHHEQLKYGTRILYQLPPWLPRSFCEAWQFDPPFLRPEPPWDHASERRVYENVQFLGEGGYFDERTACTRGLLLESDSPLWRWALDEPPPNPLNESQRAFVERMTIAWRRRSDFIRNHGLDPEPSTRKLTLHGEWFVQFQVLTSVDV